MPPDPRDQSLADSIRLRHMLDAAREAVAFGAGRSLDDLRSNRLLLLAIAKAIEIVGEAARCVGDHTRSRFPTLPWPLIVGMRHRIVHVYFDIDARIVWDTVNVDLPPLIRMLDEYLAQTPSEQWPQ